MTAQPSQPEVGGPAARVEASDWDPVSLSALTPKQAEFARRVGATTVTEPTKPKGPVFLYRDAELLTQRWLIDRNARVLDSECFHKSAGG